MSVVVMVLRKRDNNDGNKAEEGGEQLPRLEKQVLCNCRAHKSRIHLYFKTFNLHISFFKSQKSMGILPK